MIPYGKQQISQQDIEAVIATLESDFLTQGPQVPAFERAIAKALGAQHAIAVNSATSALHLACLALNVGPGDHVWTSPITFVASANCARYCGAEVDFVDIDPVSYNMSVEALSTKLKQAAVINALPKVVIPVHLCGQVCDMQAIYALSQQYGFKIIEDASHAIGANYQQQAVGNGRYSDITIFSFHPVKIITTAEGGMACCNDAELADKMRLLHSHGITRDPELMLENSQGPWYYQQLELGFNYRMTEMQAALGLSQLNNLKRWIEQREQLAQAYDDLLKDLPVKLPIQSPMQNSARHLYVIQVEANKRLSLFKYLRAQQIGVNVHYIPVHLQPYYQRLGFKAGDFPQAEDYYQGCLSLPLHPGLTEQQQHYVVEKISEFFNE
ncbi:UDP-4-amino-4,6-dideoxy-N-acetyl-beta-L-altrosamine transaminase [Agarivorans gilvus]|uniref:UDP-4-amino-4, 6-dideoxy-N-acetyl-beta-L-altrosamine transaminase n=1 Tax=Agarivorans gilvus TaxID=680279 RepID=A0ABQ1I3D7_9ALTE|nr:UDP-4-amino-4,6-dideoxy-N-acetyl-beta-L-altrosamine transaminase [Agarivorans gilvus]GGB10460.1 UDP-4-amino-4,6-dideoxy-N-acetyl-beta-L-altrosamine transaminase [Agarivorans gilvus]